MVDKNYVEGAVENAAGVAEEAAGYVTGSPGARIEGKVRQIAGKAQTAYGRAAENVSTQMRHVTKERPIYALLMASAVGFVLGRMSARH